MSDYLIAYPISETNLCTSYDEGGKDACAGDSGGPLVAYFNNSFFVLAGIVSWGAGCAQPKTPGINTAISYYVEFLLSAINSTDEKEGTFRHLFHISRNLVLELINNIALKI